MARVLKIGINNSPFEILFWGCWTQLSMLEICHTITTRNTFTAIFLGWITGRRCYLINIVCLECLHLCVFFTPNTFTSVWWLPRYCACGVHTGCLHTSHREKRLNIETLVDASLLRWLCSWAYPMSVQWKILSGLKTRQNHLRTSDDRLTHLVPWKVGATGAAAP